MGFLLSRASLAMRQHVNRLLKERGVGEVSMGFLGVLLALYTKDGQTITELGKSVSLEKSTMTGLIDRMENAGLLTREHDESDRRAIRIMLTQRARDVRENVGDVLERSYHELTDNIADAEFKKLEVWLSKFIDNSEK